MEINVSGELGMEVNKPIVETKPKIEDKIIDKLEVKVDEPAPKLKVEDIKIKTDDEDIKNDDEKEKENEDKKVEIKDETTTNDDDDDKDGVETSEIKALLTSSLEKDNLVLTDKESELFKDIIKGDATPETVVDFTKKYATIHSNRAINNFYNNMPKTVKDYYQYIAEGGLKEKYWEDTKDIDYSKIDITKEDSDTIQDILMEGYITLHNLSNKEAKEWVKYNLDQGKAVEKAEEMRKELAKHSNNLHSQKLQAQHDVYIRDLDNVNKMKQNIYNIATKGVLTVNDKQFVLPESSRNMVINAMNNVYQDKNGTIYDKNGTPVNPTGKNISELLTIADANLLSKGMDAKILLVYLALDSEALSKLATETVKNEEVKRFKNFNKPPTKDNKKSKSNSKGRSTKTSKHNTLDMMLLGQSKLK